MAGTKSRENPNILPTCGQTKTTGDEIKEALSNAEPLELQSDRKKRSGARPSEIRRFLLRFASRNKILVKEHFSDWPRPAWFIKIESEKNMATAVSYEGPDNALVMAFLSFENPSYNFLD